MEQMNQMRITVRRTESSLNVLMKQNNEDDHGALPNDCQRNRTVERVTVRR